MANRNVLPPSAEAQGLPIEIADDHAMRLAALAVERDDQLSREMAEWDVTIGDGLSDPPSRI